MDQMHLVGNIQLLHICPHHGDAHIILFDKLKCLYHYQNNAESLIHFHTVISHDKIIKLACEFPGEGALPL